MLRPQENRGGRNLLQARPRSDQDQRLPDRAGGARDPTVQSLRADPPPRTTPFRRRRHEDPRQRRRSHLSDLRDSSEHREGTRRFLPEVRGRAKQEGDQGYSSSI